MFVLVAVISSYVSYPYLIKNKLHSTPKNRTLKNSKTVRLETTNKTPINPTTTKKTDLPVLSPSNIKTTTAANINSKCCLKTTPVAISTDKIPLKDPGGGDKMAIRYFKTKTGRMLASLPNGEMIEGTSRSLARSLITTFTSFIVTQNNLFFSNSSDIFLDETKIIDFLLLLFFSLNNFEI